MRFFLYSIVLFFSCISFGQINEKGFSFQGYARDFEGNAIGGTTVFVKFSIFEEGNSASPDFTETHELETDAFGVFVTTVGSVNTAIFYSLDWAGKNFFLKAEVSVNNTDFVTISETELLSVPYAQAAGNGVPSGTILPFGGSVVTVPSGYLVCDGSEVNIADYPLLFAAIGTSWGGNGSTTFRLPDLRGQFLRGVDGGEGVDPNAATRTALNGGNTGDAVGSYQMDEFETHTHTGNTDNDGAHRHQIRAESSGVLSNVGDDIILDLDNNGIISGIDTDNFTSTDGAHTHNFTTDATGGDETRPKNAYVHYIIKF